MFERFTKPAIAAVRAAQEVARSAGATQVRQAHLLRGLLAQDDPGTSLVLAAVGTSPTSLLAALDRATGRYPEGWDEDDAEALRAIGIDLGEVLRHLAGDAIPGRDTRRAPRYSREAKKALELALREAIALRDPGIGPVHVLLGMARSPERPVAEAMAACGVDRRALRAAVTDVDHRWAG